MDATPNSASDLATRILKGDGSAESQLVERYARPVKLILLKRTRDPQLTADLTQDTFVIALQKLRAGELRNPEALAAFLRQIAINLSIEHYRREKRYVSNGGGINSPQVPHIDQKAEQMDRHQARRALEEVLSELAMPRDREILRRFYLLEEEKSRICGALDLSAVHFDRVLYRAKQRMRNLIKQRKDIETLLFGGLFDG